MKVVPLFLILAPSSCLLVSRQIFLSDWTSVFVLHSMKPVNFYYEVSGEEAERLLLKYGCDGEFLARPSGSAPNHYTLSINRGSSVTHIKIQKNGDSLDLFGGESFASLSDLVSFYIENPDQLKEKNGETIVIRRAVKIPVEEAGSRRMPHAERWFHANITGRDSVAILAREKQWSFLVRESQRTPGQFVISVKSAEDSLKHIKIERNPLTGRFHVGGGDEFASISHLLSHYKRNPMVEQGTQNVVRLTTIVPSTRVLLGSFLDRVSVMERAVDEASGHKDAFSEEFERLNNADEQLFSRKQGKLSGNIDKNRYKNIVPYDHTRVLLKDSPSKRDYINANYIRLATDSEDKKRRSFISTQGCLPGTVGDFWRMCHQEGIAVIVMTTKENERGRAKCERYWPAEESEMTVDQDEYTLRNIKESSFKHNHEDSFIQRTFQLVCNKGGKTRTVTQLQFVAWPDHGCPEDAEAVLAFLALVDSHANEHPEAPVVVHCSAGIGRTGTFIVLDVLLREIDEKGRECYIDVASTVLAVREQRQGMVQTEAQYRFIYRAVACYVKKKLYGREDAAPAVEALPLPSTSPDPLFPLPDSSLHHSSSQPKPLAQCAYVNGSI